MNEGRRRSHALLLLPAAVLTILLSGSAALAITMPLTVQEASKEAGLVVHGRVVSVEGRWTADGSAIYSDVVVAVQSMVAGRAAAAGNPNVRTPAGAAAPAEVTLRVAGGEADGVGMVVADSPAPKVGEEVVLFLAPAAERMPATAGRLSADSQTLTVVGHERGWYPVSSGAVSVEGQQVPVAAFMATIERALKE